MIGGNVGKSLWTLILEIEYNTVYSETISPSHSFINKTVANCVVCICLLSFTPSPSSLSPVVSMVEAVLSLLAARNVARTLSSVIGRTL